MQSKVGLLRDSIKKKSHRKLSRGSHDEVMSPLRPGFSPYNFSLALLRLKLEPLF
jgi:hypothetical protein